MSSIQTSMHDYLDQHAGLRYVFYGGKGGVGKTALAGSTAVALARQGRRVMLASTNPVHSLTGLLDQDVFGKPTPVTGVPNLWAYEIDTKDTIERSKNEIREKIQWFLKFADISTKAEEFVESATMNPAFEESAMFENMVDLMLQDSYDVYVFDTAPTANARRLLGMSQVYSLWVDKMLKSREEARSLREMLSFTKKKEKDPLMDYLVTFRERMARARQLLTDPTKTAFFFVTLPEALPIAVITRFIGWFHDFGIPIGGVVVNMLIDASQVKPDAPDFVRNRLAMQQRYMEEIWQKFDGMVRALLPLYADEVRGTALIGPHGRGDAGSAGVEHHGHEDRLVHVQGTSSVAVSVILNGYASRPPPRRAAREESGYVSPKGSPASAQGRSSGAHYLCIPIGSPVEHLPEQLSRHAGIGLAAHAAHHLPHQPFEHGALAGVILLDLLRMAGDDALHDGFQRRRIADLGHAQFLHHCRGAATGIEHDLEGPLGAVLVDPPAADQRKELGQPLRRDGHLVDAAAAQVHQAEELAGDPVRHDPGFLVARGLDRGFEVVRDLPLGHQHARIARVQAQLSDEAGGLGIGQLRQRCAKLRDPGRVRGQGRQVWLREIAIVIAGFLDALHERAAVFVVPPHGDLLHQLAGLDQAGLAR